ncbi:MAG: hypothetical protein JST22_08040 [Bacteroidetes bacterium]|nr:hypothetical protein [Bacteroidota bacterium]
MEPSPTSDAEQHWPGVFVRGGHLYLTWGELRAAADTNVKAPELWYVLTEWSRRGEGAADLIAAMRPDSIEADFGAVQVLKRPIGYQQPQEFDGNTIAATLLWRGDLVNKPGGQDSVYKAHFHLYQPSSGGWRRTTIYETTRSRQVISLRPNAFNYNPNDGTVLCAWTSSVENGGSVTAVDTSGAVAWNVNGIPMPPGRYSIVPIRDREFILFQDTLAIHYSNGTAMDTTVRSVETGLRYQRLNGDRYLRTFVGPDTAHYTVELYDLAGTKLGSRLIEHADAQPYTFITENGEDGDLGFIAANSDGAYAMVLDRDLNARTDLKRITRGTDTTFYPTAGFFGDTLYAAWQDNRNHVPDIYGRAYATGTFVFAVDPAEYRPHALELSGVAPNPAHTEASITVGATAGGNLLFEIVDNRGCVVKTIATGAIEAGQHQMLLDVSDLPSGSYQLVAHTGRSSASARLVVVR